MVLRLYQWLWHLVLPWLRFNARLKIGFEQRTLRTLPPRADLWIQAASVGEAYLAGELVKGFQFSEQTTILLTTNTSQGFDILEKIARINGGSGAKIMVAYCPFDKPSLMTRALTTIAPRVMILLESELWPGLMAGCKNQGVKLLVVNGRMTQRSLHRYLRWPSIWRDLRPSAIMAMSEADSARFAALFGDDIVSTMSNIKFDRIQTPEKVRSNDDNPLLEIINPANKFVVLGSVRQEEEEEIAHLLLDLTQKNSHLVIGLFPRHMHRLSHWQKALDDLKLLWRLRSHCTARVEPGTIILWDTMGELESAYDLAGSAFIGGSLAPVGGQNFLEPLSCGIRPVIGPHWTNFAWIGREIIDTGLVFEARDRQDVAHYLLQQVESEPDRQQTKEALAKFVRCRQGGTSLACQKIQTMLEQP
ncbi:MAG: 3-deoxy-D-manno-octulosonic acid transferase [Proteobacteria bacterium]|nr:3-deoxy-D-manno-octulosonic acid transferase [Pseudomonadota bacterium]